MEKEKYPEELTMRESEDYDFKIFDGNSFEGDYKGAIEYAKTHKGQVYTMIDGDDGTTYYLKGYHFVNRFAFCVLKDINKNEEIVKAYLCEYICKKYPFVLKLRKGILKEMRALKK